MIRNITNIEEHGQPTHCDYCGGLTESNELYIDTTDDTKVFCSPDCAKDYFANHHFVTSYSARIIR